MKMISRVLAVFAGMAIAAGCSTTTPERTMTSNSDQSELVATQERRIAALETDLRTRERELANARASGDNTALGQTAMDAGLFPPNAKPGECYARVLIPPVYRTETETVLAKEAGSRVEVNPAAYETVAETILVKEASTRLEIIPAQYEEVTETVMVRPELRELKEVPARYETVTETVLDKAAHTVWKRGPASAFTGQNVVSTQATGTGEVMCLVEVPASYKTITKTVLASPARTEEVITPAEYKTVTKRVVSRPATTREVTIPAEDDTVTVQKLVRPASERSIEIPAEYETVSRQVLVSDADLEWRTVLCEVNMTRANVLAIQGELADRGYYKGPRDGIIGPQTLSAANAFARAKGLPSGDNYIAMEVVEALDLSI